MTRPISETDFDCFFEPKPRHQSCGEGCNCPEPCLCTKPCPCTSRQSADSDSDSDSTEPAQPTSEAETQPTPESEASDRKRKSCIRFYKHMLIHMASALEYLCEKYTNWSLKDFSKSIAGNTDDFDQVLDKIYDRYGDLRTRWVPNPLFTLIFEFLTSAVFNYISNCIFGPKSVFASPINSDVMSQLMKGVTGASGPSSPASPFCTQASSSSSSGSSFSPNSNSSQPMYATQVPIVTACPVQSNPSPNSQSMCAAQEAMQTAMDEALQAMRIQALRDQGCKW